MLNPNNTKAQTNIVISELNKNGFSVIKSVIDRKEAHKFKDISNRLYEHELGKRKSGLRDNDIDYQTYNFAGAHLYNSPRTSRSFDPLLGHPEIVKILDKVFGAKAILSQTELRNPIANAKDNYAYEWHRDGRTLVNSTLWVIVFWLFDDVTIENGAPEVKSGTQFSTTKDQSKESLYLTGKAGDVIFMNNNLLHRASVNLNGLSRWIFIPTYCPWYVKPSADFTKMFDQETFNSFSEELKQVFGYTSIVPVDERKRLYTLNPWEKIIDEIPFKKK